MKKCPFCAEEIQDEAIKCKHCKSDLPQNNDTPVVKEYSKSGCLIGFVIIMILVAISTWIEKMPKNKVDTKAEASKESTTEVAPKREIQDEKAELKNSYYGNFNKGKIIKKKGKVDLSRWSPYTQHARKMLGPRGDLEGLDSLLVEYDEIWVTVNDDGFPPEMKSRLRGQFDITKLYWKDNRIQAQTLEKYFTGNPVTGEDLSNPGHRIVIINGRGQILNKLW